MDQTTSTKMHCYRHPERETVLKCNRCEKPICVHCAILTPTGYRCPDCVKTQQKSFDTAKMTDYFIAAILAAALSFGASLVIPWVSFFAIFLAPLAGLVIAEVIRWAVQRRRSKLLFRVATVAATLGSIPQLLIQIVSVIFILAAGSRISIPMFLPLLWQGLYTTIIASSVYYRLSGIQLKSRF